MWLIALEHIRARAWRDATPVDRARRRVAGLRRMTRPDDGHAVPAIGRQPDPDGRRRALPGELGLQPGAARVGDETILLVRVEDLRGISQLHVARSTDGVTDWRFDPSRSSARTSSTTPRRSGAARTRG